MNKTQSKIKLQRWFLQKRYPTV